jgi:hypothetical protein
LAVLRWVQKDEHAAAWYAKKVARDGGKRGKAIVAATLQTQGTT